MSTLKNHSDSATKIKTLRELKHIMNALIEERLPEVWNDGDIRLVEPKLFTTLKDMVIEIHRLSGFTNRDIEIVQKYGRLSYSGTFGTIYIQEAK